MENNIKLWIAKRGYQSKWVAEQLGVSETVFSRWANNKNIPSLHNALRLADLLECKVEDLFELKEGN